MKLPKFLFMLIAILFCVSTSIRAATNSKKSSKVEKVFVIIEKYLSVENEFVLKEGFLLNAYFFLKHISLSDVKAFGLEKSDVIIEETPLIYHIHRDINLKRLK